MSSDRFTETVSEGELAQVHLSRLARGDEVAGRYSIEEELGSGGSSVVYRAFDKSLRCRVALKLCRGDRMTEASLRRFRREAMAGRDVTSEHLVRVFDIGESNGELFLTMELVDGSTLSALLRNGPLDEERAIAIFREVLQGVQALHAAGIVHRDIKPSNILIDSSGRVKIADFGLVRRLDDDGTRATRVESIVGTLEYIAPEQANGGTIDSRTDLYSLGVVLFEMLTGRVPFERETTLAMVTAHLHDTPPDVRELRPEVSPWLARLVARLLAKSPAERPSSTAEVLRFLETRKVPRGRTSRWRVIAAAALPLLILIVALSWNRRPEAPPLLTQAPDGAVAAVDRDGRELWRVADTDLHHGTALLRKANGDVVVAAAPGGHEPAQSGRHVVGLHDAGDGRVLRHLRLPSANGMFGAMSDSFTVSSLDAVDFDGDGNDELAITMVHRPYWPAYVLLYSQVTGRVSRLFFASGNHRFLAGVDVTGDGVKEAIIGGINNRLGWYNGVAAVDLQPLLTKGGTEEIARTPDFHGNWATLRRVVWYALLPRGYFADKGVSIDSEKRIIAIRLSTDRDARVTFDGFSPDSKSSLPPAERRAIRREAYRLLNDAERLIGTGSHADALSTLREAKELTVRANDVILSEWIGRLEAKVLIAMHRDEEAERLLDLLRHDSDVAADIAYDAGIAYHRRGAYEPALRWYRQGITRGAGVDGGRMKFDFFEQIALIRIEQQKWPDLRDELHRFQNAYPAMSWDIPARYLDWKLGGFPDPPADDVNHPDLLRIWTFELQAAKGEPADTLLPRVDHLLATTSGSRALLLAIKADLQAKRDDRAGAAVTARAALAELTAYRSDLDVRAHRAETLTRLGGVAATLDDRDLLAAVRLASREAERSES